MQRVKWGLVAAVLLTGVSVLAQRNAFNTRARTDANGYLITSNLAYTAPDGPLTAFPNLLLKTDANGYLQTTMNGAQTVSVNGIATTSTNGMVVQNSTAATGGATVQYSPRVLFRGNAWDTAASETVDFFLENQPTSAATPTGTLRIGYSLNSAGATSPLTLTSAGALTVLGNFVGAGIFAGTTSRLGSSTLGTWSWTADGTARLQNNGQTIGAQFKVDALPTVGSGFGTSPSVTAGSTPLAGSVNVGTGGTATTGVITWGGTAFPSTPFCTYSNTTTNLVTRGTPTTTQLTLNTTTAWTASDIVSWICISSK